MKLASWPEMQKWLQHTGHEAMAMLLLFLVPAVSFEVVFFRLFLLPFRSVWVVGDDFHVEIGFQGVGEDASLGIMPTGEGPAQAINWLNGLRGGASFVLTLLGKLVGIHGFTRRAVLDIPSITFFVGRGIKVLFEETIGASWSAYGWVGFIVLPPRTPCHWSGEKAQVARSALATELNCQVADEQPTTWPEVVSLGAGVAQGILDDEPKQDSRPWAWGCEPELSSYDQAVSWALFASDRRSLGRSGGNRLRRLDIVNTDAWHGSGLGGGVAWWDAKAQQVQDKADQGDAFGLL